MAKNKSKEHISPIGLALIAFSYIWGFRNLVNAYFYYEFTGAIGLWVINLIVYFLPSLIIVAEFSALFKGEQNGITLWVSRICGNNIGFMCAWYIWISNVVYLTQKPSQIFISFTWLTGLNGDTSAINPIMIQLIGIVIIAVCIFIASRGFSVIKIISSIAGAVVFSMSFIYILLMLFMPAIQQSQDMVVLPIDWHLEKFFPYDIMATQSLTMIIFSLSGVDMISPYIDKLKKPKKGFVVVSGILLVVFAVCVIAGTIALAMMFGQNGEFTGDNFLVNGSYAAFQKLGLFLNMGDTFMYINTIADLLGTFSVVILTIDTTIRFLVNDSFAKVFPKSFKVTNKFGAHTRVLLLEFILIAILLILPCLGLSKTNDLIDWLIKITSICIPFHNLFIFAAYIRLICKNNKLKLVDAPNYSKGKIVFGAIIGGFCFFVTLASVIVQLFDPDFFKTLLNVFLIIALQGSAFIFPLYNKFKYGKSMLGKNQ